LKFIAKIKNFWSYESYVKKFFLSPKLQKILLYTSVFLWWSPKNTPALYSLINHCDFNDGVYFPTGGINAITQAFVSLALELWVEMNTDSEVKKIIIENGKTTWILLTTWKILWDIVVSSGDYHHADQVLIDPEYRQYTQKKWESMTLSPSGFILYLGFNKKISLLQHHTLFFDSDWDRHFDSIYKDKNLCETPSYYVSCVSKTDETVAPEWCEAVFVFVPTAPSLTLSEWEKKDYADKIISWISRAINEDISSNIEFQRIYTGDDFSKDYFAFGWNALGLAHTLKQTLTLRPKNKHPKVSGLYFTWHYTTPGTWMPMVLISSKLVKDKILSD
jgi:phytoene desaturase